MLQVTAVPAFRDNYIWAIHARRGEAHAAILVDPGDPDAILSWLESRGAQPVAVLITHHHGDHVGGLAALARRWPVPVYGPAKETIPGVTQPLVEGNTVAIPELGLTFQVMETPGHTRGHVCYYGHDLLFSGDTLFSCGCGRLFEGTAEEMHRSLQKLARLPTRTQLYCAHEYTLPNIGFAMEVDHGNPALEALHRHARQLRKAGLPTLPSTMGQELASNPFLRCHEPALRVAISHHAGCAINTDVEAFSRLRQWKDNY